MELFLLILAFLLILLGIAGAVLPVLPGPPVAYAGLLVLHFTAPEYAISIAFLIVLGVISLVITLLDYIMPAMGTKYFGGSKYGSWGSTIGLVVGVFTSWLGPWGILIGPFLGALIGELIYGQTAENALKSAVGSFLGFLGGTFMKLMIGIIILFVTIFYLIKGLL